VAPKSKRRKGLDPDLADLEWELACVAARAGHSRKLRQLLSDSGRAIPAVARVFLVELLDAVRHGRRGLVRKVDDEDATHIRFLLREHARPSESRLALGHEEGAESEPRETLWLFRRDNSGHR
jgi:hypothetical protein